MTERYNTKKIEKCFDGCCATIETHIKNGLAIECEVRGGRDFIHDYRQGQTHHYIGEKNSYAWAKPIKKKKTEMRVKKASEIVKWLEDNGYRVLTDGHWVAGHKTPFSAQMFKYCGHTISGMYTFIPEWLEEVENNE